jgi:hypothetical protein
MGDRTTTCFRRYQKILVFTTGDESTYDRDPFRLYITAKNCVIAAVLTQVTDGKEHIITYLRRCLINAETRYLFIEIYVYPCFMLVPNYDITFYLVLV